MRNVTLSLDRWQYTPCRRSLADPYRSIFRTLRDRHPCSSFLRLRSFLSMLFGIGRIVKQQRQLDAAMTELRKIVLSWIGGIEIRCCVVRRKQHQRVQEGLQRI